MRTRMSGGVGRAIGNDGPYPIYATLIRLAQERYLSL